MKVLFCLYSRVIFFKAYSENSKFYFRTVNLRACVRGAEKGKGLMAKTVRRLSLIVLMSAEKPLNEGGSK